MADPDGPKAEASGSDPDAMLAEIQRVLFGGQLSAYDEKLRLLDQRLRGFIRTETAALELRLRGQIEKIVTQLDAEDRDRSRTDSELNEHLKRLQRTLSQSMDELVGKVESGRRSLRAEALARIEELSERFREHHERLARGIDSGLADVRTQKADRTALSNVLLDAATLLGRQSTDDVKH